MAGPGFVGVVLCGGASTRMGFDKALLGSPPWASRVAGALSLAGCEPVVLLGGDPALDGLGLPHLADPEPGSGPLAALTAVTREWGGAPIVVASCDLPMLEAADVRRLMTALGEATTTPRVAAYLLEGRIQWSLLALDADAAAEVETLVQRGDRALRSLEPWCTPLSDGNPESIGDVDDREAARRRGLEGPWPGDR